ncbi:N-acetylglucosamine-6-phosphate deacetylase [Agrococcus baldri]|uniref:N-acetylglucosamine-6-phosphate deacetylase n=1 Tax=Agrococcus baldri TaxID=153730 RepID=A0AA87RMD4_9MICO|nr:amidohydrolase family protein [Agrococcus baldri]GEK81618.1 N-acetylglucosamine-6-phosphate deacetylase [Agrococcus baldri]
MTEASLLLKADRALVEGVLMPDAWLQSEGGVVTAVGQGAPPRRPDLELPGATLVPGFVDLHCHGALGSAFDDDEPDWHGIAAYRTAHGSTRQVVSLVTAPLEALLPRVAAAAARCAADAALLGVHLEGPFLADSHRGAHDPAALQAPTPDAVERLLEAGDGRIQQVTIAPELPGAIDAIGAFTDAGVLVAVGHTGADTATARAAFDAGATLLTHACNGMPPMHHRAPGPLAAALLDERVTLEAIADGEHVAPEMLALLLQSAPGRIALVTDAMAAAGMADGDYRIGSLDVRVEQGLPRLAEGGAIAGSTLTLDRAIRVLVAAGVPLEAALDAATRAPADAVARPDLGRIQVGARADLVALDQRLEPVGVWRDGVQR